MTLTPERPERTFSTMKILKHYLGNSSVDQVHLSGLLPYYFLSVYRQIEINPDDIIDYFAK